ncbi:MAG: hypothetical protein U9Q94_06800 [Candidatus Bipolaricaulota bacterium]|nr:hypothetical protein [Candidatus Bipolaricaulota bacterium]
MIRRRERYPYEWCVAVSGALLLVISPWAPSTPFSSLLTVWSRWIADLLPGFLFVGTYDRFLPAFLPFIGAATLIYPILAFCEQVLETPKSLVWIARATAVPMFLLSGMAIVDATLATGTPWKFGQIAVSCGIGVLLAMFGIRLRRDRVLSSRIRTLGTTLFIAGVCIASFVLLPIGLLVLFVAYIMLAIVLAQRKPARMSSTKD